MAKVERKESKAPERVWARVTVSMAGARRGNHVLVDPADPDMARLFEKGALVLLEDADGD